MGVKKFKPTTPNLRFTVISDFKDITKKYPEKSLLEPLRKSGGRNSYGRITARGIGGGNKRMYRVIDFKRDRFDAPAKVLALEYDPNRSARIALIQYGDGQKSYILAPFDLKVGDEIISTRQSAEIQVGNCMPLRNIPLGIAIHNLEVKTNSNAQMVRGAGTSAQIMAKEGDFAQVQLPSGEIRLFHLDCRATIGQVGNIEHSSISLGKAGRSRWYGKRPLSRGLAMNPHDHPHGGGEGKSGQGNPHPVSPWGMPTKGYKTRKKTKYSDRFIVKRRR
ncbi:MAG TPA: 50S ribosomal protein L2 [Candidatus Omnitrophota bacterium]|nr:50S ribosomal protein L2 [Candidatus Omnitrophota bacterium]